MRGYWCSVMTCAVLTCAALVAASPLTSYQRNHYGDAESESVEPDQQLLLEVLARYRQDLVRDSFRHQLNEFLTKRGADFGVNRGHSAAVAAQQRMGIEAANDVYGPGRKRRQAA